MFAVGENVVVGGVPDVVDVIAAPIDIGKDELFKDAVLVLLLMVVIAEFKYNSVEAFSRIKETTCGKLVGVAEDAVVFDIVFAKLKLLLYKKLGLVPVVVL